MGIMGVLVPVGLIILIGCWLLTWRRLMDRLPALDPSQRDVLVERWSQLFGWSLASLAPLLLLVTVVDDVLRSDRGVDPREPAHPVGTLACEDLLRAPIGKERHRAEESMRQARLVTCRESADALETPAGLCWVNSTGSSMGCPSTFTNQGSASQQPNTAAK